MANQFDSSSFLIRLCMALFLVLATYNPSGYSWIHWFIEAGNKTEPFLLLAGISLLIGWVIFLKATFESLDALGIVLGALFLAAVLWVFISYGLLSLTNTSALAWIALLMLAVLLAVGISWSHIRRRLTGQVDVDEIEEH